LRAKRQHPRFTIWNRQQITNYIFAPKQTETKTTKPKTKEATLTKNMTLKNKIQTISSSKELLQDLKSIGHKIVFTNGCFDLLHLGHVTYLEQSKSKGDFLIVGLNSDASVKRLKGAERPIKDELSRASILAALSSVDMVIVFEEDTPIDLISAVIPAVLVKGGDYKKEDIVGAGFVEGHGGSVDIIPFLEGHSSTDLINKING
jgi:rfaE bifunctional protein nucleotidyltransferase chain/domain